MTITIALSLCVLVPFIFAGLYMLVDPSNSIRLLNKFQADMYQLEANTLLGEIFGEPKPITDSRIARLCFRAAGLGVMVAGLLRLYSL